MVVVALAAALVVLVAGLLALLARAGRTHLEGRLGGIEEKLDRRLGDLDARVDRRLGDLDGRLLSTQQSAGQATTQIVEKLAKLEAPVAKLLELGSEVAKLEQLLRPPKARGGFGELLVENLLRDPAPAVGLGAASRHASSR